MDGYLFDPKTTFLNSLFLGGEVGNQNISPELRQVIATNQTRDAVRDLSKLQVAALYGQRESLALQRDLNDRFGDLSNSVAAGFGDVTRGFGAVETQIGQLAEGMQTGFEQIGVGLQSGFQAVVKGLYHVDGRLGQRMMVGFSSLGRQLQQQHGQTIVTLVHGFDFLSDAINSSGDLAVSAIERTAAAQIAATTEAAQLITKAILVSGHLQTEAIVAMHRQMTQQLGELANLLRHPDAVRAVEHFIVGMNFLNNADIRRAQEQFRKSMGIYAGHFPTIFAFGFCSRILDDTVAAQQAFEAALSQTDPDPQRAARQRSLAALYLGRIAFDRQDYQLARSWFHQAYRQNDRLWNALVEGAASLLLDAGKPDRGASGSAIKADFNRKGAESYLCWYLLALTLATSDPVMAVEAFRHGAHGDYRAQARDRVEVTALLWRLNPRTAGTLLKLLATDFDQHFK